MAKRKKSGPFWPTEMKKFLHALGQTPCGSCTLSKHTKCRPRLDGTLCSCSCPDAQSARDVYEQAVSLAKKLGDPTPTVLEAMSFIFPILTRRIEKNIIHTKKVLD